MRCLCYSVAISTTAQYYSAVPPMHYRSKRGKMGKGDPHHRQNVYNCSLGPASPLRKKSLKSVHNFLRYFSHSHTDARTDCYENITSSAEVIRNQLHQHTHTRTHTNTIFNGHFPGKPGSANSSPILVLHQI